MLLISRSLELFQDCVWAPLGKMLINKMIINYIDPDQNALSRTEHEFGLLEEEGVLSF